VGILNASINFGFLNFFSLITGITGGLVVAGYNVPGTILASLNSYVWNKLWVFKTDDKKGAFYHIPKFILSVFLDIAVNGYILVIFTTYLHPLFGFSDAEWLNVAKILSTLIMMIFNFFIYKFFVFNRKDESTIQLVNN
jgi:putative flippase GtrA